MSHEEKTIESLSDKPRALTAQENEARRRKPKLDRDEKGHFVIGNKEGNRFQVGVPSPVSKYTPDMPQRLIEYFTTPFLREITDNMGRQQTVATPPPSIVGFSKLVGVYTRTLYSWVDTYPEFAEAYAYCQDLAQQNLIDGGLTHALNANMSRFVLSAQYGMMEKTEQKQSVTLNVLNFA